MGTLELVFFILLGVAIITGFIAFYLNYDLFLCIGNNNTSVETGVKKSTDKKTKDKDMNDTNEDIGKHNKTVVNTKEENKKQSINKTNAKAEVKSKTPKLDSNKAKAEVNTTKKESQKKVSTPNELKKAKLNPNKSPVSPAKTQKKIAEKKEPKMSVNRTGTEEFIPGAGHLMSTVPNPVSKME